MRAIKEIIRRSASRKNTGRTTKRARPPVVPKPGGVAAQEKTVPAQNSVRGIRDRKLVVSNASCDPQ